uniref:Uncharacterized protein n=1 Tax=Arundo donax TaxID=35708 RepID=A0A0A8YNZ5_ARUDO
MVWRTTTNTL